MPPELPSHSLAGLPMSSSRCSEGLWHTRTTRAMGLELGSWHSSSGLLQPQIAHQTKTAQHNNYIKDLITRVIMCNVVENLGGF